MALDLPENLSAYVNNTKKEDIVAIGDKTSDYNRIYADLINNKDRGIRFHKSLDFSNVGMPTVDSKAGTDGTKFLRQFHQTRLYISDYGGMLSHGTENSANSTETYLISANLPQQFSYDIGSTWTQPFSDFNDSKVNAILQLGGANALNAITGTDIGNDVPSTNNRIASLKIWNGSKPLALRLRIPVIDDGHPNDSTTGAGLRTNLVEALEFLGSLCLPKSGISALGFYLPPPSPYDFNFTYKKKDAAGNFTSEIDASKSFNAHGNRVRIMLQLGGILLVDNVIIEGVTVEYPNTKTMIRHWYKEPSTNAGKSGSSYLSPLLAEVTLSITTSEALTANAYSNMLWLKKQNDQGKFSTSNEEMSNIINKSGKAFGGLVKNGIEIFDSMFA